MSTRADKSQKTKNHTTQNLLSKRHQKAGATFQFADNRRETAVQRKLSNMANGSQQVRQLKSIHERSNNSRLNRHKSSFMNRNIVQRIIDKDYVSRLQNLAELNDALFKLSPQITGISLSMFQIPGANISMLNHAIAQSNLMLYDGIKRMEIINALRMSLATLVNSHPPTFHYDTHGDKHFPGGDPGTKFSAGSSVVNPKLRTLILPLIGRIRRDAKGKKQSYYLTTNGIPECKGMDLTIQVDFDFETDSITYHGYPDDNVISYALSRTKNGSPIP